ncbi:MAG: phage tail sheath subtilisin-like domain-containing protein [Nitrososphaeraceae archaeon]|nr:phage tail sheath subtilisin-like domain-containing protein [Nitrososphaeraceae archaeon]
MPFISLSAVQQTAPGTFITERTSGGVPAAIATFNSTYMLIECDDNVSVSTFPFFSPVQVIDLDDYLNLIGGSVPLSGPALVSYNSVKQYFRNAGAAILYVVRVGRPEHIARISVDLDAIEKVDENGTVTAISQLDTVYVRLEANGVQLGEFDVNGIYLGIPVQITTEVTTNSGKAAAAKLIRDAIVDYINSDSVANSSIYVRSVSVAAENGALAAPTLHWVEVSPRQYGQNLVLEIDETPTENIYFVQDIDIAEVSPSNVTTYIDYIQALQTSFSEDMDQGYIIAPSAFSQFDQTQRLAVGTMMENLASADGFSWMAIVDCGPADIDDIETYTAVPDFDITDDYVITDQIKVDNAVYEWEDNYTAPTTTITEGGLIDSIVITAGGTGYTNGTYNGVDLTGGSGTGGTVDVTVAGGVITTVTIVAEGTGYVDGEILSVADVDLGGGGGSGLQLTIQTRAADVADAATVIYPANSGNEYLANGIVIKDTLYKLPIILVNESGGTLPISTIQPSSGTELDALELELGKFTIKTADTLLNESLRAGDLSFVESAIDKHSRAFTESQLYTTPKGYLAYYAPWVIDLEGYEVPPSAHIAAVAVRRYSEAGFQHPPAGVTYALRGVTDVEFTITKQHQLASNPKGLNAIRNLRGHGVVIWGGTYP